MNHKTCVVCGKELKGVQRKFCSPNCKQKHFHKTEKGNSNSSFRQLLRSTKRKFEFITLKGGKCEICGYDKNISALDFHHIDPSQKSFPLDGRTLANGKWEKLCEEVDKCMLLCANCHRELHNEWHDKKIVKEFVENYQSYLKCEKIVKYCKDCGKILLTNNKTGYCAECLPKYTRKTERPTKEILEEKLKNYSLNKIGQEYGVTHNAVKKWAIQYGIWNK